VSSRLTFPTLEVPHPKRPIVGDGCDAPAVHHRHRFDPSCVSFEGANQTAAGLSQASCSRTKPRTPWLGFRSFKHCIEPRLSPAQKTTEELRRELLPVLGENVGREAERIPKEPKLLALPDDRLIVCNKSVDVRTCELGFQE
jgi:hypothetical protein